MVNKQGQRYSGRHNTCLDYTFALAVHLLFLPTFSRTWKTDVQWMFSIHRTEVQDCQQLLQLSWPLHSNCISPAMLGIPTTCLLHTDPVHMLEGSVLHQSRDKLHVHCLSKGSLIQATWVHNEHPSKYFLVKTLWLSKSQNTLDALQPDSWPLAPLQHASASV
jgi:hypothetical protein